VCSTFIWKSIQQYLDTTGSSLNLVTNSDPRKLGSGGLFKYSVDDRKAAANTLYNIIFNKVYAQAGWFGEMLTDASDATANQVCNCFASDACDDNEDNDRWKNPGIGATVSPQDLMEYSLFGALEPLVYRSGGLGRKYVWTNSPGTSSLNVTVVRAPTSGATPIPYSGARVTAPTVNGTQEGTTDSSGKVTFDGVPQGRAVIQAEAMIGSRDWTGQTDVTVGTSDTSITVELASPDEYRLIRRRRSPSCANERARGCWCCTDRCGSARGY
jgi:hypothetical protein